MNEPKNLCNIKKYSSKIFLFPAKPYVWSALKVGFPTNTSTL